jgi:ribosomal protein S18 acetylase RimI-like enzyme
MCDLVSVILEIRDFELADEAGIVDLSLRAWAPVFASIRTVLGWEIDDLLVGDWRQHQTSEIRGLLADRRNHVWVAESDGGVVGFVAARCDDERRVGEITMLAVDPPDQRRGVGTKLTQVATDWMRASGMQVAVVETGGDLGHAPARRLYEGAGFTLLPIARYFQAL